MFTDPFYDYIWSLRFHPVYPVNHIFFCILTDSSGGLSCCTSQLNSLFVDLQRRSSWWIAHGPLCTTVSFAIQMSTIQAVSASLVVLVAYELHRESPFFILRRSSEVEFSWPPFIINPFLYATRMFSCYDIDRARCEMAGCMVRFCPLSRT